tara:strand:- start:22602 stop:23039 length:438 start_codon:yes stop_codon:yes gene_type:complete
VKSPKEVDLLELFKALSDEEFNQLKSLVGSLLVINLKNSSHIDEYRDLEKVTGIDKSRISKIKKRTYKAKEQEILKIASMTPDLLDIKLPLEKICNNLNKTKFELKKKMDKGGKHDENEFYEFVQVLNEISSIIRRTGLFTFHVD